MIEISIETNLGGEMKKLLKRGFYFAIFGLVLLLFNSCGLNTSYSPSNKIEMVENCNYNEIRNKVEIVFAESGESLQKYGYQGIYKIPDFGNSISYNKLVGKKGKVLELVTDRIGISFYKILLENCEIVYAHKMGKRTEIEIDGTYAISELDESKKLISKNIWISQNEWNNRKQRLITEDKNIYYPIDHLEQVKVVDVFTKQIGHSYGSKQFFLKVQKASGEIGYLGYNDENFYENNPIDKAWDKDIISLIKAQRIIIGMTKEQILLSWGKPDKINRTVGSWGVHEQWIYGDKYLYLENDKLTSFQD